MQIEQCVRWFTMDEFVIAASAAYLDASAAVATPLPFDPSDGQWADAESFTFEAVASLASRLAVLASEKRLSLDLTISGGGQSTSVLVAPETGMRMQGTGMLACERPVPSDANWLMLKE